MKEDLVTLQIKDGDEVFGADEKELLNEEGSLDLQHIFVENCGLVGEMDVGVDFEVFDVWAIQTKEFLLLIIHDQ